MVLMTVYTFHFIRALFIRVVQVFFTALRTCLLSSKDFAVMSIYLTFEAPQGSWDILFDPL